MYPEKTSPISVKIYEDVSNKGILIIVFNKTSLGQFSFQTPTPNFYKILIILQKKI